ncbi:MAG: hypothetical protein EA405_10760 [Rhodospirillales bacterium]|nr:MAG: hypothetical protein EA405_10760 [Rhodospirillales bacterium]
MADPQTDSLLREIDEDIRRERYALLWKRYGAYVIALAVALVLAVVGYEVWRERTASAQAEAAERFAGALALAETDPDSAAIVFESLATDGPGGYKVVARLQEGALLARQGDVSAAVEAYNRLAAEAREPVYRDLAILLAVLTELRSPEADAAGLRQRLMPLTTDDRPWRYTAREMVAHLHLEAGEHDQARTRFAALAGDLRAPLGTRSRAENMLAQIDGG